MRTAMRAGAKRDVVWPLGLVGLIACTGEDAFEAAPRHAAVESTVAVSAASAESAAVGAAVEPTGAVTIEEVVITGHDEDVPLHAAEGLDERHHRDRSCSLMHVLVNVAKMRVFARHHSAAQIEVVLRYAMPTMTGFCTRILLVLVAMTGCANPTYDEPPDEPKRVCDIRELPCQQRALELAAKLRGTKERPKVTVSVVDAVAFIAEAEARGRMRAPSPDERLLRRGLALLGASTVPADRADEARSHYEGTRAFYRHGERSVTILDRGEPIDDVNAFTVLTHELTHALQGADGFLDREQRLTNDDAQLAARAMAEGEATLIELRAYALIRGWGDGGLDWPRKIEDDRAFYEDLAARSTDLYRDRYALFAYHHGLAYVYDAYASGGMPAVRRLFGEDAPESTSEVMRGYLAHQPSPLAAADVQVAQLGAPWRRAGVSHLGGWLLDQATRRSNVMLGGLPRGDSLTLFESRSGTAGEPEVALYWRVEFDHPDHSRLLRNGLPHLVTTLDQAAFIAIRSGRPDGALPANQVAWERQVEADLLFGPPAKALASDQELRCAIHAAVPPRFCVPDPTVPPRFAALRCGRRALPARATQ